MRRPYLTSLYLALSLLLPMLTGCRALFGPPTLPRDPLFVSRKPLEVESSKAAAPALVRSEPQLPSFPTAYLAARARALPYNPNSLDANWPTRRAPSAAPGVLTSHPNSKPLPAKTPQP